MRGEQLIWSSLFNAKAALLFNWLSPLLVHRADVCRAGSERPQIPTRAWAVYFRAVFKSRDDPLIQFYTAIKDPWIRPIMSRPMAEPGVLHVIIGGCAITKLLLMRFHKAPNQAVPPCILANSLKNNSFPKTIANWGARRGFVLPTTTLHFQPSQARGGPYPNEEISLSMWGILEGGGISSQT